MGDVVKFSAPVINPSAADHVALRALMKYMSNVLRIPYKSFEDANFNESSVKNYTNEKSNQSEVAREMFNAFSPKCAQLLVERRSRDVRLDEFVVHILRHLYGDDWLKSAAIELPAASVGPQAPDQAFAHWLGIPEERTGYIETRYCGLWRVFRVSSPSPATGDAQSRPERIEINCSLLNIRPRSVRKGALCDFRWYYLGRGHERDEYSTFEGCVIPNIDRIEFLGRPTTGYPLLSLMVWRYTFNPEISNHAQVTSGVSLSLNTSLRPVGARVRAYFLGKSDELPSTAFDALKNQELNAIGVGSIESLKELIPAAQFEETQRYLTRYNPILGISPAPDDTGDG